MANCNRDDRCNSRIKKFRKGFLTLHCPGSYKHVYIQHYLLTAAVTLTLMLDVMLLLLLLLVNTCVTPHELDLTAATTAAAYKQLLDST